MFKNVIRWWVSRVGSMEHTKPMQGLFARRALKRRIIGQGPWRMKLRSSDGSYGRSYPNLKLFMKAIDDKMEKVSVGDGIEILAEGTGAEFYMKKGRDRIKVPVPNTSGNDDVDKILAYAIAFAGARGHIGICAKRNIGGTSTPSQHCPWKNPKGSNAVDLTWKSLSAQRRGVNILIAAAKKGDISMGLIISDNRDWEEQGGWSSYGGLDPHTSHAHAQGKPESNGAVAASC
jgi:hypothetical protein